MDCDSGDLDYGCVADGGYGGTTTDAVCECTVENNAPDPVIASVTVTGCSSPGQVYTGGPNGTCDQAIGGPYVGALQQVGQNMGGFNGLTGAFVGGSLVAGAAAAAALAAGAAASLPAILGEVPGSTFVGGAPSFQIAIEDLSVVRITPTATNVSGAWTTTETITSGSQATSILALPPSGGGITSTAASFITNGLIPAGSGYFIGTAASLFGQPGGGVQIWGAPAIWGATSRLPWIP